MVTDRLCPEECTSGLLDVCIKLDSCPSGRCFNIIIWASFALSLCSIGCLWAGSWGSESKTMTRLRAVSQTAIILRVLECEFCWFSLLDVLRDCLQENVLKDGMTNMEFESFALKGETLNSFLSWYWVFMPEVGFMGRLFPSLFYLFQYVPNV